MEKWDHNTDIHRNDNGNDKHGGGGGDVCNDKTNRRSWKSWRS